jgi:hypothetical protein
VLNIGDGSLADGTCEAWKRQTMGTNSTERVNGEGNSPSDYEISSCLSCTSRFVSKFSKPTSLHLHSSTTSPSSHSSHPYVCWISCGLQFAFSRPVSPPKPSMLITPPSSMSSLNADAHQPAAACWRLCWVQGLLFATRWLAMHLGRLVVLHLASQSTR